MPQLKYDLIGHCSMLADGDADKSFAVTIRYRLFDGGYFCHPVLSLYIATRRCYAVLSHEERRLTSVVTK